jgi:hypothetical protein
MRRVKAHDRGLRDFDFDFDFNGPSSLAATVAEEAHKLTPPLNPV